MARRFARWFGRKLLTWGVTEELLRRWYDDMPYQQACTRYSMVAPGGVCHLIALREAITTYEHFKGERHGKD